MASIIGLDKPKNWPVIRGCHKVSDGCEKCYVERLSRTTWRKIYSGGFENIVINPGRLDGPDRFKSKQWLEIAMHSDLFQPEVTDDYIMRVLDVVMRNPHHLFQTCTKYPERMESFICDNLDAEQLDSLSNLMLGVSIERRRYIDRMFHLASWPHTTFVEFQPLLERISNLDLHGIDWIKIGCETGPQARDTKMDWIMTLIDEARIYELPVSVILVRDQDGKIVGYPEIDGRRYVEKPQKYNDWRDFVSK